MKKEVLILSITLLLVLNAILITAQNSNVPNPGSSIPVLGDINPNTGLPRTFEKFQAISDNLSNEEVSKQYLQKEWTVLVAKNPVMGPVLFYTENFFSMFNPLWKIVFGITFSWSWAFFLALGIWLLFIIIFYSPSKHLTNFNPVLTLIASIILASIMGTTGLIRKAIEIISPMITVLWQTITLFLALLFLAFAYNYALKQYGEHEKAKEKKEKLQRSEDKINALGDVAGRGLKDFSK